MKDIEKMMRLVEFVDTGYQGPGTSGKTVHAYALGFALACAAAILLFVIPVHRTPELTDTYDSPELAYAKLEQSFGRIAHAMDKSIHLTEKTYNKMTYENNK